MKKKILSMIVAAVMCISLLPMAAFADTTELVVGDETTRFEAEDFVGSGNRVTDPDKETSRFSNEKAAGSIAVTANITAANAGVYDMSVKWGNRFGEDRNVELAVNGKVLFSGQTGFTYTYQVQSFTVELNEGTNTVTLTSPDNNLSNFRLDYFEFTRAADVVTITDKTVRFEGEDYNSNPNGTVEESSSYSGGKRALAAAMSLSFNCPEEIAANITIKWGTKGGNSSSNFKVNGVTYATQPNKYWQDLTQSFIITLPAGANSIEVTRSGDMLWLDYVEVAPIKNIVNLAAGKTITLEAEDYADVEGEATARPYNYSGGKRVTITNGTVEANVYAEEAGVYEIKAAWGAGQGNPKPKLVVNGVATDVKSEFSYWKSAVKHANVNLNKGINNIKIAKGDKLWVDYIKISPVPTLSKSAKLRLEAEDYRVSKAHESAAFFDDGTAIAYNQENPLQADFVVEDAGDYVMTIVAGGISGDSPAIPVSIDGTEVFNASTGATTDKSGSTMTEIEGVAPVQVMVTLSEGPHILDVDMKQHASVDYIEFSAPADYYTEMNTYELLDEYVDGGDCLAALDKTYLGDYTGVADENILNTAVKALGSDMSYVYWPFGTEVASDYYLKITYASAAASAASVIVDPETLPTPSAKDYATVSASGSVVEAGTWQKAYSNGEGGFYAPYFTEKIFNLGNLDAGEHNFVFMYDPSSGANEGVAIRKVELLSVDKLNGGLYATEAQFAAEAVGATDAASTAALVDSISAANTYSADSVEDADKNTTTVVKYVYNNAPSAATFTFIAAAYDENGVLSGITMSDEYNLAKGASADIKVKVNTDGADYVKTFALNMTTLKPVLGGDLFGK